MAEKGHKALIRTGKQSGAVANNILAVPSVKAPTKKKFTVLSIRVSKGDDEKETPGPIAAEHMFATLHGICEDFTFWQRLFGHHQQRVSFEIAHIDRQIKFYVWFPTDLRNLVEGQLYAQYPDVEIEEVQDYALRNIPHRQYATGATIEFVDPDIFPIKRYPQFEDKLSRVAIDPMAGITATMAKLLGPEDQAWLQVCLQPMDDDWRVLFSKCIRILSKGVFGNIDKLQKVYARLFCTRKKWLRIVLFPIYFIFWIQGITSGFKKGSLGLFSDSDETSNEHVDEMSRAHERETVLSAAGDKVSKLLFEASIRMVYLPKNGDLRGARLKMKEIAGSFKQFNIPQLNGFQMGHIQSPEKILRDFQQREISDGSTVMNIEELATIYHLPSTQVQTPNIAWVRSKKLEPPTDLPNPANVPSDQITLMGQTNFRGMVQPFGILQTDRRRHVYIIGKTGMGKSTLLENMLFSDIRSGKGVAVVDPHGDLADRVIDFVPASRTNDVIIFDPSDRDFPIAFNMLENVDPAMNSIVASGLVGIFKKIYAESWGPRLEHFLRNTILALLEYPNTTMLGITRMLTDQDFRRRVVRKITDPVVKSFWINEFEKVNPKLLQEVISPILNKVGQFLSSPIIRNIVGQPKSEFNPRFAMDRGKIIIVNLSKGKIGEDNSALLGAMIITKFQLDAMSRANIPESERKDFYLYVDEFQNFATEAFATILSEARKYRLNLTLANQYIAQMPEEVSDAVFGNVGTVVSFQVGFDDAEAIRGQFGEDVGESDLVALQVGNIYLRLLVNGMPTPVFSCTTYPRPEIELEEGRREKIIRMSRERYTKKREMVEDKIRRWSQVDEEEEEQVSVKKT